MSDNSCRAITMSTSAESLYTKLKLKTPGSGPAAWRSTTGQYFSCAEWDSGEWTCTMEEYHKSVFWLRGVRLRGVDLQHGGVPQVSIFLTRSETPGSGPAAWWSTTGQYFSCAEWDSDESTLYCCAESPDTLRSLKRLGQEMNIFWVSRFLGYLLKQIYKYKHFAYFYEVVPKYYALQYIITNLLLNTVYVTSRAIFMLFVSRGGERGQGAQISQKYSVVVNIPTTTTTTSTTALPTTTVQTLENATVDEVRFVYYLLWTSLQQPSQNQTSLQIKFVKYENWENLVLFFLSNVWLQVKVYF